MATELISFGVLPKMYEHLRTSLRKKIAREFNQPQPVFVSWLHALTAVRNVCTHHSRSWNRELAVKPELPVAWKASGIGNDRFYVIALMIQTLLTDIAPDSLWGHPPRLCSTLTRQSIFGQCNFPTTGRPSRLGTEALHSPPGMGVHSTRKSLFLLTALERYFCAPSNEEARSGYECE